MLSILLVTAGLVVTSVAIHLGALHGLTRLLFGESARVVSLERGRVGLLLLGAIFAHLLEIWIFAATYWSLAGRGAWGALKGVSGGGLREFFYFSAVTYTSLGYGDITPTGELRLLAAVEALTGLVLVTWTASLGFLVMQRYWIDDRKPS